MASKVDIGNLALSHIAQGVRVNSIFPPDGSFFADVLNEHYGTARDIALEMHEWTFATTRVQLAEVVNPMPNMWTYAYALPPGIIRPVAVLSPNATDDTQGQRFHIEIDYLTDDPILYTNQDDAVLKFIRRVDDPVKYTPLFVQAMSWLLAHFAAGPITKKTSVVESTYKVFMTHMTTARGANAASNKDDAYSQHVPAAMAIRGIASQGRFENTDKALLPDGFVLRS